MRRTRWMSDMSWPGQAMRIIAREAVSLMSSTRNSPLGMAGLQQEFVEFGDCLHRRALIQLGEGAANGRLRLRC